MFVLIRLLVVESTQPARTSTEHDRVLRKSLGIRQLRAPPVYEKTSSEHKSESISDATTQMDHNAVVLFTIDRLARSPRTTVRKRGTELAPDR